MRLDAGPEVGGGAADPPRVLFVETYALGWKTWATAMARATAGRADLRAEHVHVRDGVWVRALGRRLPGIGRSVANPDRVRAWLLRRRVGRAVAAGRYAAVVVGSQSLAPPLLAACRASGTPLVVSVDTTGPSDVRDLRGEVVPAWQDWAAERAVYDAATVVAPWSTWAAASLAADFGVPGERVLVTPPAVRIPPVAPPRPSNRLPRILFVGNDWVRKGGPRLLAWHQRLWRDRAELHVASAKAPADRGAANVVWHGAVPHGRVLGELLPGADLFVLPTTHDMSPFAVAEAQAAGVPVVTSRLAGLPDLVVDGVSGMLVGRDDDAGFVAAVERLLGDPGLRASLSAAARRHAAATLDESVVFPRLIDRVVSLCRPRPTK